MGNSVGKGEENEKAKVFFIKLKGVCNVISYESFLEMGNFRLWTMKHVK